MMQKQRLGRYVLFFLAMCGVWGWLLLMAATEWSDWSDSDSWLAVKTTHFTIQPKSSSVRYQYVVKGQSYEGSRTHFFVIANFQDQRVIQWINNHRRDTELTVFYDPDTPQRSVLVREIDSQWAVQFPIICGIAGGTILIPLLLLSLIWGWLRRQF